MLNVTQNEKAAPPSKPPGASKHRYRLELAGVCLFLLTLRILQLLSYAPLLYGFEFAQLGQLAWEVTQGHIDPAADLPELIARYQYGAFAQGTLIPSVGAALLAKLGLGATIWSLHATAILCDLLAVTMLLTLLQRLELPSIWRVLAVGSWIMGSGFAVAWQLMPYGNHVAFLMMPLALARVLLHPPAPSGPLRRWLEPILLLALAFVLYRLNLAACLAYATVCMWLPGARGRFHGVVALIAGIGLALLGLRWLSVAPEAALALAPRFEPTWDTLFQLPSRLLAMLPAPGQQLELSLPSRVLLLAGLPAALWVAFRKARADESADSPLHKRVSQTTSGPPPFLKGGRGGIAFNIKRFQRCQGTPMWPRRPQLRHPLKGGRGGICFGMGESPLESNDSKDAQTPPNTPLGLLQTPAHPAHRRLASFAALWATLALVPPLISRHLNPEYLLPGTYGLVLCWISLLIPGVGAPLRRLGAAALGMLLIAGLVDNAAMIRPSGFDLSRTYDGAELWRRFHVINLDVDELPAYRALMDADLRNDWIGFASNTESHGCPIQPARTLGRMPDPGEDRCQGWPPGTLAQVILEAQKGSPKPDLEAIGIGAWVVNQRSIPRLEAALEGLSPQDRAQVLEGARKAAQLVPSP